MQASFPQARSSPFATCRHHGINHVKRPLICDTRTMTTVTATHIGQQSGKAASRGLSGPACLNEMLLSLVSLRDADNAEQIADKMRTVAWLLPPALGEGCYAARIVWLGTAYDPPGLPAFPPHIIHPFDVASRETGSIELWRTPAAPLPPRAYALLEDCGQIISSCLQQIVTVAATRERAEQYRSIFDYVTEALVLYDLEGIILDINAAALRLLGADHERLRGRWFGDLLPPDDAAELAAHINRIRLRGMTFAESHLRRMDGRPVPVEMTDRLLLLQGRQVVLSNARDISERHSAREALERRMEREHLVGDIATLLAGSTPEATQAALTAVTERLGNFLGVRHVWFIEMPPGETTVSLRHEWRAAGATSRKGTLDATPLNMLPWSLWRLTDFETVAIEDAGSLGKGHEHERDRHREMGLVSTLAVPLRRRAELAGCLAMDDIGNRKWSAEDIALAETVGGMLGAALDRTATLLQHQRAHAHIAAILDTLPAQVAVVDGTGRITHVNASWLHAAADMSLPEPMRCLPGADYLSALDAKTPDIPSAGDAATLLREILAGRREGGSLEYEVMADGRRHFMLQLAPLMPPLTGAVLMRSDVTALRRAEADLARSEVRYRMLLDTMQEGLLFTDAAGRMTYINGPFCAMVEHDADALAGREALDLVAPESRQAFQNLLFPGEAPPSLQEITWLTSKGGRAFSLVSPSILRDSHGHFIGLTAMITNITQRRILESQLAQTQKLEAVGSLATGIAHEINSPVQYLGSNLTFLQHAFDEIMTAYTTCDTALRTARDGSSDVPSIDAALDAMQHLDTAYLRDEAPRALRECLEGVEHIAAIVRSVRQFAHPGNGTVVPVDINFNIESTVNVARSSWRRVASLRLDLAPGLPPVPCVPSEFNQTVLNLLINAVHAIEDRKAEDPAHEGSIVITSRLKAGWAEVSVSDNGAGIKPEHAAHVFDPFFTTKPMERGTGQGLAIAHACIVGRLGGQLFFRSEPGLGSTFFIRLPFTSPSQEA